VFTFLSFNLLYFEIIFKSIRIYVWQLGDSWVLVFILGLVFLVIFAWVFLWMSNSVRNFII